MKRKYSFKGLVGSTIRFGLSAVNLKLVRLPDARQIANNLVYQRTSGIVQSGPFKGLVLSGKFVTWSDGDIAPKLLGLYENELHATLEKVIAHNPSKVVNVGSAEGYYAVGLAMSLPGAKVFAIDIDSQALRATMQTAHLNGIENQIACSLTIPDDALSLQSEEQVALWLVDVEGAEREIMKPEVKPTLKKAICIIELHEFIDKEILAVLTSRFEDTHNFELVVQGARNPNESGVLNDCSDEVRWMAVCEYRPELMRWLILWPKGI